MSKAMKTRIERLEGSRPEVLSEKAKAWLGLRHPLTLEELAKEPAVEADLSGLSGRAKEWLSR